jgi:hypothetical protein
MVVVDPEFRWLLSVFSWHKTPKGYMRTAWWEGKKTKATFLHAAIWELAYGKRPKQIDHINQDKLDCRLENLRAATGSLNAHNVSSFSKKSSLPQGVRFSKKRRNKPYHSVIDYHERRHCLGCFATPEEASAAYRNAKEVIIEFEALLSAG